MQSIIFIFYSVVQRCAYNSLDNSFIKPLFINKNRFEFLFSSNKHCKQLNLNLYFPVSVELWVAMLVELIIFYLHAVAKHPWENTFRCGFEVNKIWLSLLYSCPFQYSHPIPASEFFIIQIFMRFKITQCIECIFVISECCIVSNALPIVCGQLHFAVNRVNVAVRFIKSFLKKIQFFQIVFQITPTLTLFRTPKNEVFCILYQYQSN